MRTSPIWPVATPVAALWHSTCKPYGKLVYSDLTIDHFHNDVKWHSKNSIPNHSWIKIYVNVQVYWSGGPLTGPCIMQWSIVQASMLGVILHDSLGNSSLSYYPGQRKLLQPRKSWGWSTARSCDIVRYRAEVRHRRNPWYLHVASSRCRLKSMSHDITWSHCGSISWIPWL